MDTVSTCSADGCDRPTIARGLCTLHYQRYRASADFAPAPKRLRGSTITERLWLNFEIADSGCWRWTGNVSTSTGYGCMTVDRKPALVHRLAYEAWIGPIPPGLTIDHVLARGCIHKDCLNPAHLEAVTPGENARRGRKPVRTHCKNGHEFTLENRCYRPNGWSYCRLCRVEQDRARTAHDIDRQQEAS